MKVGLAAISLVLAPVAAGAQDVTTYVFDGAFEDATFNVESAIIGKGLVIDHVSHIGEMLLRTGADIGSTKVIFEAADVYQFCSAVLSRKVMEADPLNIAHCPYGIFVTDDGAHVLIGYRHMPDGPMDEVEKLLDALAVEAAEG